ncbi:secreted Ly-6/uPAR-related protein 1-like [Delphinus delphis]|uniref:secreted Ly-6/uPAR-related protein 1-like n=1 Tax=Delphinus delphis TaxID=9728 RepID=UPI0028C44EC7|nr:secreted Ly-6/uPAR-related protein 1-like [Delphinus delphis]
MAFPRALLPPLLTSASTVSLGECGWLARGPVSGSRLAHLLSGEGPSGGCEALRCFTCEQPTALPLCETITNCKPEDTACETSQLMVESGEAGGPQAGSFRFNHSPGVTSSCSSSCETADPDSIGAAYPSYCCSHDLCNSMGVARLSAGALAPRGP